MLIVALDGALPLWLAALIVTVLWLAIAAVLAMRGQEGAAGVDAAGTPDR